MRRYGCLGSASVLARLELGERVTRLVGTGNDITAVSGIGCRKCYFSRQQEYRLIVAVTLLEQLTPGSHILDDSLGRQLPEIFRRQRIDGDQGFEGVLVHSTA